jgi:HSP20 family protein
MNTHHLVPRLSRAHNRLSTFPGIGSTGFDRLFSDILGTALPSLETSHRPKSFVPRVDIDETEDEFRLSAELPGLEEGDFEVLVEADVLSIKGERKDARAEKNERYARVERARGAFHRSFRLPFEVDPETVNATYRNGVLAVTVPKPEVVKPKERIIPVTISN